MERAGKHRSDLFWYVLIGLLVLFAIGVFVVYVPESKRPDRKWAEFAFFSSFLCCRSSNNGRLPHTWY